MSNQPKTLAEQLLCWIAEDETMALAATPGPWWADSWEIYGGTYDQPRLDDNGDKVWVAESCTADAVNDASAANGAHIARHDPARILADLASKRRIVDAITYESERAGPPSPRAITLGNVVLAALASIYADRPEWREEWR